MHIAICDDNVADRKQLERLLKRESDKRVQTSSIIYADSFGHPEQLLSNPMQYDAFFLDLCLTDGPSCIDVVDTLTAKGNFSPVILCCSKCNYRDMAFPERVLFLDKPIKTEQLSAILDEAQKIKDSSIPTIELREDKGTYYVTESDILYATQDGNYLIVTLKSGQKVRINTTPQNFFSGLEQFPVFFSPNARCVVNGRYIEKIGFRKITMCDGTVFKVAGSVMAYAKHIYETTH